MPTRNEEALQLIDEVLRGMLSGASDLKASLRKVAHACHLLDWQIQRDYYQRQLMGFPQGIELPWYRKAYGRAIWRPKAGPHKAVEYALYSSMKGTDIADLDEEPAVLDIVADIDWLQAAAQGGYSEVTEEAERYSRTERRDMLFQRVRIYETGTFQTILQRIEAEVYKFASEAYTFLRYGNSVANIFDEYRRKVDALMSQIGGTDQLRAIEQGVASTNPAQWQQAALGCRILLQFTANHLWRDERKEYDRLPGDGPNKKLVVTEDRPKNRLAAYLHHKGLRGHSGELLKREIDRLWESLTALFDYQSQAKTPISRDDLLSIVLATYYVLGDLALKTNLEPVEQYGTPVLDPDE